MAEEIEISWSEEAEIDFCLTFEDYAAYNLHSAQKLAKEVIRLVDKLPHHPEIGRMVPEFGRKDLRERICAGKYRIIYRVYPERIEIVAFHPSRQPLPDDL